MATTSNVNKTHFFERATTKIASLKSDGREAVSARSVRGSQQDQWAISKQLSTTAMMTRAANQHRGKHVFVRVGASPIRFFAPLVAIARHQELTALVLPSQSIGPHCIACGLCVRARTLASTRCTRVVRGASVSKSSGKAAESIVA